MHYRRKYLVWNKGIHDIRNYIGIMLPWSLLTNIVRAVLLFGLPVACGAVPRRVVLWNRLPASCAVVDMETMVWQVTPATALKSQVSDPVLPMGSCKCTIPAQTRSSPWQHLAVRKCWKTTFGPHQIAIPKLKLIGQQLRESNFVPANVNLPLYRASQA